MAKHRTTDVAAGHALFLAVKSYKIVCILVRRLTKFVYTNLSFLIKHKVYFDYTIPQPISIAAIPSDKNRVIMR